jgi:hypothetical protein
VAHAESWLMAAGCRPQNTRSAGDGGRWIAVPELSKRRRARTLRLPSERLRLGVRAALAVRTIRPLLLTIWALGLALPSTAAAVPEQGIYFGCRQSCEAGLDAAQTAGLSFVIAPPSPSMAAALQARGMSAFWNVSFHTMRPDLVKAFATHPVTRGWYVADEPSIEDGGRARWWTQQIHMIDPVHPTLSVHFGCRWADAAAAMRPFKDAADWLGTDCYPVGPGSSWATARSFAAGANIAGHYRKPFWAVTQAASWDEMCGEACGRPETAWPSPREMQIMRDCAAAAGARVIAWFSLNAVISGGERRLRDLATAVKSPERGCRRKSTIR